MPPTGKLDDAVIADILKWIEIGARPARWLGRRGN